MRYSFMIVDPPDRFEDDINTTFVFIKTCGYEGVELNLTPGVIDRLYLLATQIRVSVEAGTGVLLRIGPGFRSFYLSLDCERGHCHAGDRRSW